MAPDPGSGIRIAVAWTPPGGEAVEEARDVPPGTTAGEIAAATGAPVDAPVGVWGRLVSRGTAVRPGDRVEVHRALPVDAKEARRRRAAEQRRAAKRRG